MSKTSLPHMAVLRQSAEQYAAIYARVSTTEQADTGYSLPKQIGACQRLAHQEGYTVPDTHIFVDDYTGTSLNRPQFMKLRGLVRQRLVQAVFVFDLDRLSRKLAHQLLLSEEFEQAGVALRIVTMPDRATTPEAHMLINMRGVFAEYERYKILERTRDGLYGRANEGFPIPNTVPLGYRFLKHGEEKCHACGKTCTKKKKTGCYVIDEEEAALVRRIFTLYVEGGHAMLAIARQLTLERLPTPRDRREKGPQRKYRPCVWHSPMIQRILTSETYIGCMHYGKRENLPKDHETGKRPPCRWRPKEEWVLIPVPPIIDEATFAAAQAQAERNAQNSRRNRRNDYLLVNARLRCGQCKRAMRWVFNKKGGAYCCTGHRYLNETLCRGRVSAAALEEHVWHRFKYTLRHPELIAAQLEDLKQMAGSEQSDLWRDRRGFEAQLARCAQDLKKWEDAYENDVITLMDFKEKKAMIDARRASVEQELARLAEQQHRLEYIDVKRTAIADYCQRVSSRLKKYTRDEKREALEVFDIVVTWYPDKSIDIKGVIPIEFATHIPWDARRLERSTGCRP
jgi:site-specific DNA recombinase